MSRLKTYKLWQQRLLRFDASQMTVTQFCLSEGISQASFYKWKKRFQDPSVQPKPRPAKPEAQFIPLRLTADSANDATVNSRQHDDRTPRQGSHSRGSPR